MSEILTPNTQNPFKLYMDTEVENQPEGTYPFALNSLDDSEDGSKGAKVNEIGNIECLGLEDVLKGWIKVDEKTIVLFVGVDYVHVFNPLTCTSVVYNIQGLNFGKKIKGTSRVINGCERVIYFKDDNNSDRYFNIDNVDNFKTNGNWDIKKFDFIPNIKYPYIETNIVTNNGSLEYGTYFFVIEILDDNLNVIYTSLPQGRTEINKGLNQPVSSDVGGKRISNDSISLIIRDLDTSYSFYRITAIVAKGNNNSTLAYRLGTLHTISNSNDNIIIPSISPDNGDFMIDRNEVLQGNISYNQSKVITQTANTLLKANLKDIYKDYSTYQRYASKIKTEYVVRLYDKVDVNNRLFSERGDEVMAYFIHYLDDKGFISPPFHIPGRPKEVGDDTIVSLDGVQYPKWKVLNTGDSINKLGYYETNQVYENPPNICDDIDYWGKDFKGNFLEGSKVRHHKIPDRNLVPIERLGKIQYIGVTFSNIEYPDNTIVGHFFSSVSADEVIASGLSFPFLDSKDAFSLNGEGDHSAQGAYVWRWNRGTRFSNLKVTNFISYDSLFNQQLITGNYISMVGRYIFSTFDQEESEVHASITGDTSRYDRFFNSDLPYEDLYLYFENSRATQYQSLQPVINKINDGRFLLPKSFDNLKDWYNNSLSNSFNLLETGYDWSGFSNPFPKKEALYTNVKNISSKLNNLESLQPRILHDQPYQSTDVTDTFFVFGGTTRISTTPITNIAWLAFNFGFLFQDDVQAVQEILSDFYMESNFDASLRLDTTSVCNSFYQRSIIDYTIDKLFEIHTTGTKTGYKIRDSICKEWYGYNYDYNMVNYFRVFKPLSKVYNYCSKCLNYYPNRIIYSNVGTNEDTSDSFLKFKPLNYIDLPNDKGEIIAIDDKDKFLVVRTTNSCFVIPINFQTLKTDSNTTYIGTGEFLSLTPTELNKSDIGYGGQQDEFASCNTPFGLFWIDNNKGSLLSFTQGIKEISLEGMYHFLRNELPIKNFKGVDISKTEITYDDKYKRLIISKIDYEPTDKLKNLEEFVQYRANDFLLFETKIYVDNTEWFKNKSFTLSFDLLSNSFKSFHSYLPQRMLFDENTFFSTHNNKLWIHNSGKRNHYYDTPYPYIIEIVVKNLMTFYTHALHYFSTSFIYSQEHDMYYQVDNTFDQMIVYSDYQSTGVVNLVLLNDEYSNIDFSNIDKFVIKTDQNYKISQIKDIAIDTPTFSKSWTYLQNYYINNQGYMDKEFINIDYNKYQHELSDIKSKAVRVRLIFNNSDIKIVTHLLQTYQFYSVR